MSRDLILVAMALVTWGAGEGMFLYFEPLYLQQLGANPVQIGGILGGVGVFMVISYLPAGYLSDRFGRRPLLRIAWCFGMAATWIMALAETMPIFVTGMALYSFTSFVVVPLNSYITQARGKWSVGRTITLISACYNVGVILGPLIGGWIGDQYGLRRTFLVAAFVFLGSTLMIFFISAQPIEKAEIQGKQAGWRDLVHRRFIQYLLVIFFVMFALYLPQPLSQNYLQNERGLTLSQIGQLIATRSLGIVVLNLSLGQITAHLGFLLAQVGVALFSFLLWRGASMPWYMAGYFLLGSYQTARALAVAQGRTLIRSTHMGVGYGLIETAMAISVILAPPLAGIIYIKDPTGVYPISLGLIGIAILITAYFSPVRWKEPAKQTGTHRD
jgi:MFS transporter, DHA1 family, multidrug resistance protein